MYQASNKRLVHTRSPYSVHRIYTYIKAGRESRGENEGKDLQVHHVWKGQSSYAMKSLEIASYIGIFTYHAECHS